MDTQTKTQTWQERAAEVAHGIRKRTLGLALHNGGCYLSQACCSAETLATLYTKVLNLGPSEGEMMPPKTPTSQHEPIPYWGGRYHGAKAPDKDRFLIGIPQYAPAVYSALVEIGRMAPEGVYEFNADGGTVEMIGSEHSPGFELSTGTLGQCLSQAGGIAMARKRRGETGRVVCYIGDGELQEGQNWEAIQALVQFGMDNVVIYADINGQQCDGRTEDVMDIEPLDERFRAFKANVVKVDGHDVDAVYEASLQVVPGKPLVVLCYTDPTRGMPILQERWPKLHYVRFTAEDQPRFQALYESM